MISNLKRFFIILLLILFGNLFAQMKLDSLHFDAAYKDPDQANRISPDIVDKVCNPDSLSILKVETPIPNLRVRPNQQDAIVGFKQLNDTNFFTCLKENAYQLNISALGFADTTLKDYDFLAGEQSILSVRVKELREGRSFVRLSGNIEHKTLKIIGNNIFFQNQFYCLLNQTPESYLFRIINPDLNYVLLDTSLTFNNYVEDIELRVQKKYCYLKVNIEPSYITDIDFSIKKKDEGNYKSISLDSTPLKLEIGTYQIKVRSPGFYDKIMSVVVVQDTVITVQLQPKDKKSISLLFGLKEKVFGHKLNQQSVVTIKNCIKDFFETRCKKKKKIIMLSSPDAIFFDESVSDSVKYQLAAQKGINYVLTTVTKKMFSDFSGDEGSTLRFDFFLYSVKEKKTSKYEKQLDFNSQICTEMDLILNEICNEIKDEPFWKKYLTYLPSTIIFGGLIYDICRRPSHREPLPEAPVVP